MITKCIDLMIAPHFKKLMLWAKENYWRELTLILLLAASLIFIIMFSKWVSFGGFYALINQLFWIAAIYSFNYFIYLLWLNMFLVLGVILALIYKENKKKSYEVKIKSNSKPDDFFIIPTGSDWNLIPDIEPDIKTIGPVLSVTNSDLTGHLLRGNEWHNYKLSFRAKIIKDNFTFAVRTIDKNNCMFFQCTSKSINPHLVVNGIAIRNFCNTTMTFEIPEKTWVDVSVLVKGKKVSINIEGFVREFSIPQGPWFIHKDNYRSVLEYQEVMKNTTEALGHKDFCEKNSGAVIDTDELDDIARKLTANIIKVKLENYYIFNFDFDRGTIGFRESGQEHALFHDIKVEVLDAI
jgi:hypothetical protein